MHDVLFAGRGGRTPWYCAAVLAFAALPIAADEPAPEGRTSRIEDDRVIEVTPENVPPRPKPLLEIGSPFLGTGNIGPGLELPGGAVLQPQFLVFGTYRTAVQWFNDGETTFSEWANRLDIFGNLQLTGTERVLVGFRPLDEDGRFSGYNFTPDDMDGGRDELNGELTTLFFEGDIGEMFPAADPYDSQGMDWGISVGRQPLFYQEGMLIDDDVDAIGITRNTLLPEGGTDLQFSFVYGWNEVHRDDNRERDDTQLFGFFTDVDYGASTYNVDFVYVLDEKDDDDGAYWGVSAVQRIGHYNTSFRALGSHAIGGESDAISSGYLLFGEVSWTPPWTHDNMYVNGFVGIDNFSSAARGPATGGPLGRTGILFAAVGLGRYGAALGNRADESYGGAVGYQMFLDEQKRQQLIVEFGGRHSTEAEGDGLIALGARYQQALGQQWVFQIDLFGSVAESRDEGFGTRFEIRYEF